MKFKYIIIVYVLCVFYIEDVFSNFIKIKTLQGELKGIVKKSWLEREFYSFTGIPYARPPIGKLRFEPPIPAESWTGLFDATKYGAHCIQDNVLFSSYQVTGSEDCLFINVYTPKLPTKPTDDLPVMFYTHGGGWTSGSGSNNWYGPHFFMDEDIVLVTYNYRLGPLGFLSTGDKVVPGNNALKDQSLALKWTKDNIKSFGGDPNRITIFGNSAGGGSTHYHLFSPLTRNLFQNAIIQSGTALGTWALASRNYAEDNKNRLAELLNCSTSSSQELVNCLKKKDASEIITNASKLYKWANYDPVVPFRPVLEEDVDGAYLIEKPETTAKLGKAANVPIILSITWDDGFIRAGHIFNNSLEKELNDDFNRIAPYILLYFENDNHQEISNKIKEFYFKNKQIDRTAVTELSNVVTDSWFLYPLSISVATHNAYSTEPVYTFLYNYRGSKSYGDLYGDPNFKDVVCHSDELLYMFPTKKFGIYHATDTEKKVVKSLIKLWTNFAKFGNPTPDSDKNFPKWLPAKDRNFQFYYMNKTADLQMIDNPFLDRIQFWEEIRKYRSENKL